MQKQRATSDTNTTGAPLLELRNIRKAYADKVAVDDISLSIPRGVIFGLLGPNGAGKTTTIRMITRIIYPDRGEILFDGQPITNDDQRRIGYLPEERGLYKSMKVREQIVYILRLKGQEKARAEQLAEAWLKRFDLDSRADSKLKDLSKGMQQKVQFITTIAHKPPLLILDEPFSGLDPINTQMIEDIIKELREEGITIIFSTHRMEQVEQMCEEIALISNGNIVLQGQLDEVKRSYREQQFVIEADQPFEQLNLPEGAEILAKTPTKVEVQFDREIDKSELIRSLTEQIKLARFIHVEPTLREIFIQSVSDDNLQPTEPEAA
ncbi:MAG: ABC transporter ATP-binding protein [Bacteroidota bacterium]